MTIDKIPAVPFQVEMAVQLSLDTMCECNLQYQVYGEKLRDGSFQILHQTVRAID
jgi:hypothetical protein